MSKARLEAFSDGVIAIIITIMVLELRPPDGSGLADLMHLSHELRAYILSFVMLGIYWNNHHVLIAAARRVSAGVLWANLHLLFWLSLMPFATAWIGRYHDQPIPVALYGCVGLLSAVAYTILQMAIISADGHGSKVAQALGTDMKGRMSLAAYVLAIVLAFANYRLSYALFVFVALIWLVPDRRIARHAGSD